MQPMANIDGIPRRAWLGVEARTATVELSGMSENAREYSPVTLPRGYAIEGAAKPGHRQIDLLDGPDTAKMRWSEQTLAHPEFVLVPSGPASLATFGAYCPASAAAAIKRGSCPSLPRRR
jgi:hypothetical protein